MFLPLFCMKIQGKSQFPTQGERSTCRHSDSKRTEPLRMLASTVHGNIKIHTVLTSTRQRIHLISIFSIFLWDCVIYAKRPQTIGDLNERIGRSIFRCINPKTLESVIDNFLKRIDIGQCGCSPF